MPGLGRLQPVWYEWQGTQPRARRVVDRICDCRRETDHRALSRSNRRNVLTIEQHSLKLGQIAEARYAILRQPGIQNPPVLKLDRFEQSSAQPLHIGTFNLIAQVVRIY